jgi:Holliday junction resolvase RusA-like endonuclease
MNRLKIKPLSVNDAWQGRRYKTKKYKMYEIELFYKLPKLSIPDGKLQISFVFGISSISDIDNPLKLLIDIFQKKYKFDDKRIYKLLVEKISVKSGQEFFEFEIKKYERMQRM